MRARVLNGNWVVRAPFDYRRADIEGQFETLLQSLTPSESLFCVAKMMFKDLWDHRISQGQARAKAMVAQIPKIDKQIDQLFDRITDVSVPNVIAALEAYWQTGAGKDCPSGKNGCSACSEDQLRQNT